MEQDGFEDWRTSALNVATRSLAVLGIVWIVAFGWKLPLRMSLAVLSLIPPAIGTLTARTRSYLLTCSLLICCFVATWAGGPTPGALLCALAAIIAAGVFLGVIPAIATWLLTCAAITGGLLLMHYAYETHFEPHLVDPRRLDVVIRYSTTYLILSSFLTLGVTAVIERLARLLRETQAALAEARAAQSAATSAQESREQAVSSLVEAQRFGVMGKLSAQIAHDFNNSLQVVLAYGWQVERGELTEEETREGAQDIVQICHHASQLSHQLLALGQRVTLEEEVLKISDEMGSIHKSLRRIVPAHISLSYIDEAGNARIQGDSVRLRQAVYNLCINAIHAMPDGGKLTVALHADDSRVTLQVADTGLGIDAEVKEKLFEPFFTTKGEGGTGLGLVTVKEIMNDFGGGISVESEPGKGSTFLLWMPRVSQKTSSESKISREVPLLTGKSILVVDDDFRVRRAVARMLRVAKARVSEAASVDEALKLLKSETFDAVCTDAIMPGRPPRELIRAIEEHHDSTRVLICSAHVEEELLRAGVASGKIPYLAKPFSQERLVRKLNALFEPREKAKTGSS